MDSNFSLATSLIYLQNGQVELRKPSSRPPSSRGSGGAEVKNARKSISSQTPHSFSSSRRTFFVCCDGSTKESSADLFEQPSIDGSRGYMLYTMSLDESEQKVQAPSWLSTKDLDRGCNAVPQHSHQPPSTTKGVPALNASGIKPCVTKDDVDRAPPMSFNQLHLLLVIDIAWTTS